MELTTLTTLKRPNSLLRIFYILPVILLVSSCGHSHRNADSITDFMDENPRMVQGLHFYPSTVRMLGTMMGDEYGTSFKDIQSGRFLYVWNAEKFDLSSHFDELIESSVDDGFELLAEMDTADGKNAIYVNDKSTPIYILLLENSFGDFVVELTGDISLQSIYGLTQLDYSSITDNFPSISAASDTITEPSQEEMIQ